MRICFLTAVLLSVAPCAAQAGEFIFPGEPPHVAADSDQLVASYTLADEDGSTYRFAVTDRDGMELAGFNFLRTVDGAWRSRENTLFVNNRTGSNVADCMVYRGSGPPAFESLREALDRPDSGLINMDWIKPAELGKDSHYFLTCENWVSDTVVNLTVEGHTDYAGEAFKYFLRYDLNKGTFAVREP
jgi:hypothetical protein